MQVSTTHMDPQKQIYVLKVSKYQDVAKHHTKYLSLDFSFISLTFRHRVTTVIAIWGSKVTEQDSLSSQLRHTRSWPMSLSPKNEERSSSSERPWADQRRQPRSRT